MIRSATIWIATLLLCPLTSRADEVDVPELGVRLDVEGSGAWSIVAWISP